MTGDLIPDTDHVAHYLSKQRQSGGDLSQRAFLPRGSEKYLSVNWLEYFRDAPDFAARLACVRAALAAKQKFKPRRSARLAVLVVGEARRAVANALGRDVLKFREHPEKDDASHAGIYGFFKEDHLTHLNLRIAEALALLAQLHDAVEPVAPSRGGSSS